LWSGHEHPDHLPKGIGDNPPLVEFGNARTASLHGGFDVRASIGRDVCGAENRERQGLLCLLAPRRTPLTTRRKLLQDQVLANLDEPIRESPESDASQPELISSVKAQGLERLVAKRRDSRYEPGQRSGAWQKMRANRGQAFVIAGYTLASRTFDAVVFGYYAGGQLLYAGRTRSGFTPASRAQLFKRFEALAAPECSFANLPEAKAGRWGEGMTAGKMKDCRWLVPALVGRFEFVEWTPEGHLRHSRFMGLSEDREPKEVTREG
jgi:ATP-dependent DNA ligase